MDMKLDRMTKALERVEAWKERGFDNTWYNPEDRMFRVSCSQCQSLVINGIATHEHGCPNIPRDYSLEEEE